MAVIYIVLFLKEMCTFLSCVKDVHISIEVVGQELMSIWQIHPYKLYMQYVQAHSFCSFFFNDSLLLPQGASGFVKLRLFFIWFIYLFIIISFIVVCRTHIQPIETRICLIILDFPSATESLMTDPQNYQQCYQTRWFIHFSRN